MKPDWTYCAKRLVSLAAAAGLLAGCTAPVSSNKKLYDRYAELVAERNRQQVSAPAPAKAAPASKPVAPAPAAAKPAAPTKPVPAPPPVQVLVPAKPAEPAAPPPAPAVPAPAPVAAPSAPAAAAAPAESVAGEGYMLKVGDGVQIYLRGIPGGELIEEIIDEQGMITLPLINEVIAAGMSASELERTIRKVYLDQDIYRNITVNVMVPTRFYFIQGEIRGPGRFQIMSATRVSQAIAAAGGYTEYASGQVLVYRNGKIFKNIRNARRLDRKPEDDILLEPDDRIEVKRSLW